MLKGIVTSSGFAIAKAVIYNKKEIVIESKPINNIEDEIYRLDKAINSSKQQLLNLSQESCEGDADKKAIIGAQLKMLEDEEFLLRIFRNIELKEKNVEVAVKEASDYFIDMFLNIEDNYFKARSIDLKDVTNRLLENLIYGSYTSLQEIERECILVATELTPSETVLLDKNKVIGIITEEGTTTSHVAILSKAMGIPSISQIEDIFKHIKHGDQLVIDGEQGIVYINPSLTVTTKILNKQSAVEREKQILQNYIGKKTKSKDGQHIALYANVGSIDETIAATRNDAEGIGLLRTEFLFLNRQQSPSEEEQFIVYKQIVETMKEKPVIIRTFDLGGDKQTPYLKNKKEENPFLGHRAIRICLEQPELFIPQIRAILRASVYGNVKILLPMITCIEEITRTKKILNQVKNELNKHIKFTRKIEIGMLIETPAAVIMASEFANEVDFFSIGTNDLIQYLMAADRNSANVTHLNNPMQPVVWRTIDQIIQIAHEKGIWVSVCGDVANNFEFTQLLMELGIDAISVTPNNILKMRKHVIENITTHTTVAQNVLKANTVEVVKRTLNKI